MTLHQWNSIECGAFERVSGCGVLERISALRNHEPGKQHIAGEKTADRNDFLEKMGYDAADVNGLPWTDFDRMTLLSAALLWIPGSELADAPVNADRGWLVAMIVTSNITAVIGFTRSLSPLFGTPVNAMMQYQNRVELAQLAGRARSWMVMPRKEQHSTEHTAEMKHAMTQADAADLRRRIYALEAENAVALRQKADAVELAKLNEELETRTNMQTLDTIMHEADGRDAVE
ncbi:hypothetical protein FVE85_5445 [Porphyridium purpureum]|uniref:Uncharacterized protein n=1 Tax=Porphyridium purpureum TaxID=35688 RepID=A0A5J4Z3J1_PORPP|nr:hypothetical protein FVE85_5445 [Porphyridium purpureum]|eukprot:POR1108..scf295_1